MSQFRRQQVSFWDTRLAVLLGVLALFLLFGSLLGLLGKARSAVRDRQDAEGEYSELVKEESLAAASVEALSSDSGKEKALREKYNLGKDGEGLVVIVEPSEEEIEAARKSQSLWQKFLNLFRTKENSAE